MVRLWVCKASSQEELHAEDLVVHSAAAVAASLAEVHLVAALETAEASEADVVDLIGVVAAVDEAASPLVAVVSDGEIIPDREINLLRK